MNFRILALTSLWLLVAGAVHGDMGTTPWRPMFKGIDHAVGTNFGTTFYTNNGVAYTNSRLQSVNCLRIDLSDPDVQLFPTPRATNYTAGTIETKTLSISNFVKQYGLQVATVANFYSANPGDTDPQSENLNCRIFGLSISTGQVVSLPDTGPDANGRFASILFSTNKVPFLALSNAPPGTNTAGIYTAVTGYYPVLTNGVIPGEVLRTFYPDPTVHDPQPRTVFGLSEDRRYFFMMIIDGRQNSYSQGANDAEMGLWLLEFGASDGVNMDGGGSAAMYYADCVGNPKPLGHSSYIAGRNRERITGSQLGIYALPLPDFVNNVTSAPGITSAIINWTTETNATTQVEYGLTPNFGSFTPLDSTPVTNHQVMVSGLTAGTRYYYRVLSRVGDTEFSSSCGLNSFVTTNFGGGIAFTLNSDWKFFTANLDGINWQAPNYVDTNWPSGPGALWADSRNPVPTTSTNFIPNFANGTRMPIQNPYPYTTYYFRKSFVFSNDPVGVSLIFSNYIDDGAIFYLNGTEIYRTNVMAAPTIVLNSSNAIAFSANDATVPIVFRVPTNLVANLVAGTNVMAVEVHNYRNPVTGGNPSPDLTFESALIYLLPAPTPVLPFITNVVVAAGETGVAVTWTTVSNATTQVEYGLTLALGSSTVFDTNPVTSHAVAITGLQPLTQYYVRLLSTVGTNQFSYETNFTTTSFIVPLVTFSNIWRYTTNNLDGTNWTAFEYDDSGWLGEGPALLYFEDNSAVEPRTTLLPAGDGLPMPTYYFRTHFTVTNSLDGFALLFTNYVDDGAVFYLNGVEVQRLRMAPAPQPVFYVDPSAACPPNSCETTVDVPDVFRVSGDVLTNVVLNGDNVLAAEVHQFAPTGSDIVFGSAVSVVRASANETRLHISQTNDVICVSWAGELLTLQQASNLAAADWNDIPGPVKASPYCTTNLTVTTFYRLRD